jgi:hypothetical protein
MRGPDPELAGGGACGRAVHAMHYQHGFFVLRLVGQGSFTAMSSMDKRSGENHFESKV